MVNLTFTSPVVGSVTTMWPTALPMPVSRLSRVRTWLTKSPESLGSSLVTVPAETPLSSTYWPSIPVQNVGSSDTPYPENVPETWLVRGPPPARAWPPKAAAATAVTATIAIHRNVRISAISLRLEALVLGSARRRGRTRPVRGLRRRPPVASGHQQAHRDGPHPDGDQRNQGESPVRGEGSAAGEHRDRL